LDLASDILDYFKTGYGKNPLKKASARKVAGEFLNRQAKITFRDERCPRREYSRRFSLCDSEAGPIPKGENLFRDEMRTWSKRNFKKLKKPVLETPGVSDPCDVAFIDYSGGGQGTISLHLVITRSDRRGQGLATKLLREFYRQKVPQGANVRWGRILNPVSMALYEKMQKERPDVVHMGGKFY